MSKKEERYRVSGVIEVATAPYVEDHGILTMNVTINADVGYHQGFGNLCFDNKKMAADYVSDLCGTFGVQKLVELVGKRCYALYCFAEHNEMIEGLESADTGRRFLNSIWRKKHFPDTESVFDQKADSIRMRINSAKRQVTEGEKKLASLKMGYMDWEKQA